MLLRQMTKLRPLLPTLKEKKRYIVFEVLSRQKIGFDAVSKAVMDKSLQFLGELGVSKAGIHLLPDKYNAEKQKGIMRVNRRHVDSMRAVFALVNKVDNQEAIIKSAGVSGILKKTERFM